MGYEQKKFLFEIWQGEYWLVTDPAICEFLSRSVDVSGHCDSAFHSTKTF